MDRSEGLRARGIEAVLWGGLGAALRVVIQIGSQILLARVLGPEQYGIFAMGIIVVSLAGFFADIGIAYGLIQKPEVTADDIRFVFFWQLVLGLFVAIVVAGQSASIAEFFSEPRTEAIVRALSVICFVNALGAVSLNLLKRRLDLKRLHLIQAAGYFAGFVLVGIPLALAGAQVWALVAAFAVQSIVSVALMYCFTRHSLGLLFWYSDARKMVSYGVKVFATNVLNWVIGNIDRVLVSRSFPSTAVGLYSTSYNVMNTPTITLMGVLQSALFAVCARAQDRPDRLKIAFLTMLGTVSLFILPVFVAVGAIAETFVLALYGEAWQAAGTLLRPLAWAMPLYLMLGTATALLWTSGRTATEFLVQLPVAFVWACACAVAVQHSLGALAWTMLALFFVRFAVILGFAWRALGLTIGAVANALAGGVQVAIMVGIAIAAADHALRGAVAHPQIWLLGDFIAGGLAMIASLYLTRRIVMAETVVFVGEVSHRLPAPVAAALTALVRRGR